MRDVGERVDQRPIEVEHDAAHELTAGAAAEGGAVPGHGCLGAGRHASAVPSPTAAAVDASDPSAAATSA